MLADLPVFHLMPTQTNANILAELFCIRYVAIEPEVLDAFFLEYLVRNFRWVALLSNTGLGVTNNSLENFQRQMADLLLEWKVLRLGMLFGKLDEWVPALSQDMSQRTYPLDALDVLDENGLVRPTINGKIATRVKRVWIKAQDCANRYRRYPQGLIESGGCTFIVNGSTYNAIIRLISSMGGVPDLSGLMYGALQEMLVVLSIETSSGVLHHFADVRMPNTRMLGTLTDKDFESMDSFAKYAFVVSLFYVVGDKVCWCVYQEVRGM